MTVTFCLERGIKEKRGFTPLKRPALELYELTSQKGRVLERGLRPLFYF
jgi:hypothetical protein